MSNWQAYSPHASPDDAITVNKSSLIDSSISRTRQIRSRAGAAQVKELGSDALQGDGDRHANAPGTAPRSHPIPSVPCRPPSRTDILARLQSAHRWTLVTAWP